MERSRRLSGSQGPSTLRALVSKRFLLSTQPNFEPQPRSDHDELEALASIKQRRPRKSLVRAASPLRSQGSEAMCGLRNLGNTCYINAVLQALRATAGSEMLQAVACKRDILQHSRLDTDTEFLEALRALLTRMQSLASNTHLACPVFFPLRVKAAITQRLPLFAGTQQQDAHEFCTFLLTALKEDSEKLSGTPFRCCEGSFNETITCLKCRHSKRNKEPYQVLSVPVPTTSAPVLIQSCVDGCWKEERLDPSEYVCHRCGASPCTKKASPETSPEVLVLHLKRFQWNTKTYAATKVETKVALSEFLRIAPSTTSASDETASTYRLCSVIEHVGTIEGGHYTVLCASNQRKKPLSRTLDASSFIAISKPTAVRRSVSLSQVSAIEWSRIDDAKIEAVSHKEVYRPSSLPYLLFYRRYHPPHEVKRHVKGDDPQPTTNTSRQKPGGVTSGAHSLSLSAQPHNLSSKGAATAEETSLALKDKIGKADSAIPTLSLSQTIAKPSLEETLIPTTSSLSDRTKTPSPTTDFTPSPHPPPLAPARDRDTMGFSSQARGPSPISAPSTKQPPILSMKAALLGSGRKTKPIALKPGQPTLPPLSARMRGSSSGQTPRHLPLSAFSRSSLPSPSWPDNGPELNTLQVEED